MNHKMIQNLITVFLCPLLTLLCACNAEDRLKENMNTISPSNGETVYEKENVVVYNESQIYSRSGLGTVTVNGVPVTLLNYCDDYDYCHFSFRESAVIELTVNASIMSCTVTPQAKNIPHEVSGKKLTITLTRSEYMIVRINGMKEIVICADDFETDVPELDDERVCNIVEDFKADPLGLTPSSVNIQAAVDFMYNRGGGIVYVPAGLYVLDQSVMLRSHVHLYLAGGAVLRCPNDWANFEKFSYKESIDRDVTWTFYTEIGAEDVRIYGRGTIDANGKIVFDNHGYVATVFYMRHAKDIVFDGILIRDSAFWTIETKCCRDVDIRNVKILNRIAGMKENDDIDICETHRAKVTHCIGIAEDDSFSTKTYTSKGLIKSKGETESDAGFISDMTLDGVTFDDCVAWSDCAAYKVGDGAWHNQTNVKFINSTCYKARDAIKITHRHGTKEYRDITFENIDVERLGGKGGVQKTWCVFDMKPSTAGAYGNAVNVLVKDINIRELGKESMLKGHKDSGGESWMKNVVFSRVRVPGTDGYAKTLDEMAITDTNGYVTYTIEN